MTRQIAMTRQIRSRRAGPVHDWSREQPLYARLLRLQHVTPSGFLCFVFLEGTVALAILLGLAELASWWGVLVLPVTVATMVKLNDVVAGAVMQPAVPVTSAPGSVRRSRRSGAGRAGLATAVGNEPVEAGRVTSRGTPAALPSVRRAAVRPMAARPVDPRPVQAQAGFDPRAAQAMVAGGRATAGTTITTTAGSITTVRAPHAAASPVRQPTGPADAGALNGPPVARGWDAPTAQLDSPEQWARQTATRRYE